MNKNYIIALYILVITNILGMALIVKHVYGTTDHSKSVAAVTTGLSVFDGDPYLNINLESKASVPVDNIDILIDVYDEDEYVCTLDESFFSVLYPNETMRVSAQLGYMEPQELEGYRFEVSVSSATEY